MRIAVIQANVPPGGRLGAAREAAIRASAPAGVAVDILVPQTGPASITGAYDDALAAPQVIALALAAERSGADAVVINCTADTGLDAVREMLAIPVVGVTAAALHLAAQLGHRFAILTFAERIAPRFAALARAHGLGHALAAVRSVELPLQEVAGPELVERLQAAARACVFEDRADTILLGCTAFEPVAGALAARLAAEGLAVPLLCPGAIGLHQAALLASLGLAHSKIAFPLPDRPATP